jgi:starch-binding outer membrane protein, SusD/RagB family
MMKKYRYSIMILLISGLFACENILDLDSLTEPVNTTFYKNEQELELALTGIYNSVIYRNNYRLPIQISMDNGASDIGIVRGIGDGGFEDLGAGRHSAATWGFQQSYAHFYRGIARANALLSNMEKARDVVPEAGFNEIKGQAMVLRAYFYMYLTELFGDVPYLEKALNSPAEALVPRSPKATIVDKMLIDLQTASEYLPLKWPAASKGKITRAVALGLRARIALYNNRFKEAANSAKAVMDIESSSGINLHADYKQLFQNAGSISSEIMFVMPYKDPFSTSEFPIAQGSRNRGSFSTVVPTQAMVDSYEAIDGKPIDESSVYDPKKPFVNRDPRLLASIVTPQSKWAGIIFDAHPDSLIFRLEGGSIGGANRDSRKVSWPGAFCGYLWKKYTDEEVQKTFRNWDDINFTLMRYAEILLIYAEAKMELGEIDSSVLTAINRIRARAYGVDITNISEYPAITTTNQVELRKVIRRERKVELANEGFRLFDIRRWRIAEKVMPVVIYGRILDPANATGVPAIDDDGFVSYTGIESQYDRNTDQRFPNAQDRIFNKSRDYLNPIPQQEIDTYKGLGAILEQNPGY